MRSTDLSLELKENLGSLHILISWIKVIKLLKIVNQCHNAAKSNIGNNSKTKKSIGNFRLKWGRDITLKDYIDFFHMEYRYRDFAFGSDSYIIYIITDLFGPA